MTPLHRYHRSTDQRHDIGLTVAGLLVIVITTALVWLANR